MVRQKGSTLHVVDTQVLIYSFTDLLGYLFNDSNIFKMPLESLYWLNCKRQVAFYLNCQWSHVVDPGYPMELSWVDRDKPSVYDAGNRTFDISPWYRDGYEVLRDLLKAAEYDERLLCKQTDGTHTYTMGEMLIANPEAKDVYVYGAKRTWFDAYTLIPTARRR